MTPSMLVLIREFPSLRRAQARLKRLREQGKVEFLDWVTLPGGVREKAYACFTVKADNVQHEVEVTAVVLRVSCEKVVRGRYVSEEYRPDAELTINGEVFYLEVDRDTMKEHQVKDRMKAYAGVTRPVLWVCPDKPRMEELMRLSRNEMFLFTTFALATADPHAGIWLDLKRTYHPLQRSDGRNEQTGEHAAADAGDVSRNA